MEGKEGREKVHGGKAIKGAVNLGGIIPWMPKLEQELLVQETTPMPQVDEVKSLMNGVDINALSSSEKVALAGKVNGLLHQMMTSKGVQNPAEVQAFYTQQMAVASSPSELSHPSPNFVRAFAAYDASINKTVPLFPSEPSSTTQQEAPPRRSSKHSYASTSRRSRRRQEEEEERRSESSGDSSDEEIVATRTRSSKKLSRRDESDGRNRRDRRDRKKEYSKSSRVEGSRARGSRTFDQDELSSTLNLSFSTRQDMDSSDSHSSSDEEEVRRIGNLKRKEERRRSRVARAEKSSADASTDATYYPSRPSRGDIKVPSKSERIMRQNESVSSGWCFKCGIITLFVILALLLIGGLTYVLISLYSTAAVRPVIVSTDGMPLPLDASVLQPIAVGAPIPLTTQVLPQTTPQVHHQAPPQVQTHAPPPQAQPQAPPQVQRAPPQAAASSLSFVVVRSGRLLFYTLEPATFNSLTGIEISPPYDAKSVTVAISKSPSKNTIMIMVDGHKFTSVASAHNIGYYNVIYDAANGVMKNNTVGDVSSVGATAVVISDADVAIAYSLWCPICRTTADKDGICAKCTPLAWQNIMLDQDELSCYRSVLAQPMLKHFDHEMYRSIETFVAMTLPHYTCLQKSKHHELLLYVSNSQASSAFKSLANTIFADPSYGIVAAAAA